MRDDEYIFPQRLKALREKRGIPQYKLAQLCGLNAATMMRYESGTMKPGIGALMAIAEYFQVSIDYLAGRTDNPIDTPHS